MTTATVDRQKEIDDNLDFFLKESAKLAATHRGKFAVIRHKKIVGFYDTIVDALTSANKQYLDELFSIQQVFETATDLGFYSHAVPVGTTQ